MNLQYIIMITENEHLQKGFMDERKTLLKKHKEFQKNRYYRIGLGVVGVILCSVFIYVGITQSIPHNNFVKHHLSPTSEPSQIPTGYPTIKPTNFRSSENYSMMYSI